MLRWPQSHAHGLASSGALLVCQSAEDAIDRYVREHSGHDGDAFDINENIETLLGGDTLELPLETLLRSTELVSAPTDFGHVTLALTGASVSGLTSFSDFDLMRLASPHTFAHRVGMSTLAASANFSLSIRWGARR